MSEATGSSTQAEFLLKSAPARRSGYRSVTPKQWAMREGKVACGHPEPSRLGGGARGKVELTPSIRFFTIENRGILG